MDPSKNHVTLETIIEAPNNDIDAVIKKLKRPKYSNLSERDQKTLEEWKVRHDIVITNAYKGGAVDVLDVKGYAKECEKQLNNTENYKRLQKDPAATNNDLVQNVLERFENEKLIHKNITEGLRINSLRTLRFYTQPKIHKKENPGRPVISYASCQTSKIQRNVLITIFNQLPNKFLHMLKIQVTL